MNEFPWSKSGKKLLNIINDIIEKEGGRYALAVKITRENAHSYQAEQNEKRQLEIANFLRHNERRFTPAKDKIIIDKWLISTLKEIGLEIGVTLHTVRNRGYKLGLPKRDLTLRGKPEYCKKIKVYYQEPIVFKSITDAAKHLGVSQGNLSKALIKDYLVKGIKVEAA